MCNGGSKREGKGGVTMKQQLEPLFTPWKIGNCQIKNRIVLTSMGGTNLLGWMEVNHFDKDGAKFILEVAKNNCGLVLPGCQPVYNPMYGQWLYKKKKMYEDLAKWMPEFHKTGAKLFVQLTAGFGRSFTISEMMETLYTNKALRVLAKPFMDLDKITAAPSPSPNRWSDKVPSREMTVEEIQEFITAFGKTAKLLKDAGVDGVEIHAVHEGYLLDQFTLKYVNQRTDEYGGSFENRYRFAVEIVKEIKKVCGQDFPVSLRYSVESKTKGFREGALPGESFTEAGRDMAESEKEKALQTALAQIEKQFGKGAVMKLGQNSSLNVEAIPTGSLSLDIALGIGGVPRGRIIEIYGPESSGKTTLAIHAIAEAQKAGGIAAFIDAEHAFDRFYAAKLGVDVDNLLISQPDNGEQALEIAEQLIRSSAIDIIVVDSVAALTPKAEIEGDMGDNKVGLQARLMSQALRKLTAAVSKTRTTCIFINQLREKIGVMFGNPETTTGGNALKFYASVRLDIRGSQAIKNGDEVLGKQTKVKVVKNKVAPPFRRAEFDIMFGEGISRAGEIIDLGAELGIVKKSGSWFSYNDTKIAQGRDAAKQVIADNPELAEELEGLIFEALRKDK